MSILLVAGEDRTTAVVEIQKHADVEPVPFGLQEVWTECLVLAS